MARSPKRNGPNGKSETHGNRGLADVRREAASASICSGRLAVEIQQSVLDPRSSVPHDEVMARMDDRIARYSAAEKKHT